MSGAQLEAMSPPDLWTFLAEMEAETVLIDGLGRLAHEPDVRPLIEQHRPRRWDDAP
jgi:hypothetical protein